MQRSRQPLGLQKRAPKNYHRAMASRRTSLAVTIVALVVALVAHPASASDCFEAIDANTAKDLFERLVKLTPGDGCALENVGTEQSQLRVEWKKDGRVLEAILVVPTSCVTSPRTQGKLSAIVPPSVASLCPASADATESLVEEIGVRELVAVHEATSVPAVVGQAPSHRAFHRRLLAEGLLAVLSCVAAGFAFVRWRRWRALNPRAPVVPPELPIASTERGGQKTRPRWQRNPGRAGWGAAVLIAPHLALGTWLLLVPDHVAFRAAQIVTLVHVGLALVALPLVGLWTFVHLQRMRATRPPTAAGAVTNRLLAGAVILAAATGLAVLWGGDILRIAPLHAACGVAVGAPLAVHLRHSARRWAGAIVAATLGVTALGALAARRWFPETTAEATVPAFSYATRDASLYEPAETCGECHVEDYADWKRSLHARTLELPNVQDSLSHAKDILGVSLTHVGELRTGPNPPESAAVTLSACGSCHAPTTFYGDDKRSMLAPTGVVAEGVGCSFCHTLRAVHESEPSGLDPNALPSGDVFAVMSRVPLFVSAPETVRRYLFQGSHDAIAHRISNLLIRWRPEVHARDYDAKVIRDSRACLACHSLGADAKNLPHMTYYGWKVSPFVTADAKTTVECQDCHMTTHLTGAPAFDPGRKVPWGPSRPRTRSHLLLGGNVHAAAALGDVELARQEHALNAAALTLSIARVERVLGGVDATVAVHANLVGHYFPAFETQLRYGWIELQAIDASGSVVAKTAPPRDSQDFGSASPFIMASSEDPKPDNQRLVPPKATREFTGRVVVPPGVKIDKLVAVLHVAVDPDPIAVATQSVGATGTLPSGKVR